ncbi:hypothetical protein [Bacillus cereus]|nr:hypothetical protein [Bacillus cereus]
MQLPESTLKTDWLAIGRAGSAEYASTRIAPRNVFLFVRCG